MNHQMWKKPILIHGYRLELTCFACPEQYDVYAGDELAAYFRLRHGRFIACVPDVGGDIVYESTTNGDGMFFKGERAVELTKAILAVQEYYLNHNWEVSPEY